MIKNLIVFLLITIVSFEANAQAPYINSISPSTAAIGETVNISGSNLSTVTEVYFGGARSTGVIASAELVSATVPAGATFDQVYVVSSTGLIGYSNEKFTHTFDGQSVAAASLSLGAQFEIGAGTQTQDLCGCDFNQDGKLDIAVSNASSIAINVYKNESTVGSTNFSKVIDTNLNNPLPVNNLICGDIDGDGWPDLIANQIGNIGTLFVYRNMQSADIAFGARQEFELPSDNDGNNRKPGRFSLNDLDLDGKPELIVVAEDENYVFYFVNTSTSGAISFTAAPSSLTALDSNMGAAGFGGLDVVDMNKDGLPDIVASNFTENGLYIFQNKGSFSFKDPVFFDTTTKIRILKTGDFNQDGYPEVVTTNADVDANPLIEIIENKTTAIGANIALGGAESITGIEKSWGLDMGDIDGDGDLDIAIASFADNSMYVAMNTDASSVGAANFDVSLVSINRDSKNIRLTDIDNDGKPDFVYTNKSKAAEAGFMAVKLNQNCLVPVIAPSGTITLCTGASIDLVASSSGHTYDWKLNGISEAETSNTLTVSVAGTYTATIQDECTTTSTSVTVVSTGETYSPPSYSPSSTTPCEGDNLSFSAPDYTGTNAYLWSGPNGFTSTVNNPSIANITALGSGEYQVITTSSAVGCQLTTTFNITVISSPVVTVNNTGSDLICATGGSVELSSTQFSGISSYQWKLDGVDIAGQTDPASLTATSAGAYSIETLFNTCTTESSAKTLESVDPPVVTASVKYDGSIVSTICENVPLSYEATWSNTTTYDITYTWDFDNGTSLTGQVVDHAHTTAAAYSITLDASYDGLTGCSSNTVTTPITIVAPPSGVDLDLVVSDNTPNTNFEKCADEALTLRVEATYKDYQWYYLVNTDTTTISTATIAQASVEEDISVKLTNDVSCVFHTDPVTVSNYTNSGIFINPTGATVVIDPDLGKTVTLDQGQTTITLTVENNDPTSSVRWQPASALDNTFENTVQATPKIARQLITVEAFDLLGCFVKDSVTLIKPGIKADASFTPNGDGIGDCWQVTNISGTDCTVIIFDNKGRRITEVKYSPDTSIDDCVWDGTKSGGNALPDGVYYYILNCSDSENEDSGSIFLAR